MADREKRTRYVLSGENRTKEAFNEVKRSFKEIEGASGRLNNVLGGLGVGLSLGGVFAFLKKGIDEASQAEQAGNRVSAVLRATGHQAGITKREIDALADSMQDRFGIEDESARNAAASLLKFGNIHGDVFREAMQLSADLAAFMGTDMPSAAQMLGKSLQSPTEGITMMERNFGKLTDAEEKHIKTLVRQGDAIGAQNAVLDLWRDKIGGTAELMNTGLTKATRDVTNTWNDLMETIGRTDAVGGTAERALGGLASLLKDIRLELEGQRTPLSQLIKDAADEMARFGFAVPGGMALKLAPLAAGRLFPGKLGEGPGLTEDERLRRHADDMRAQQAAWQSNVKLGGAAVAGKKATGALSAERIAELQLEGEEQFAKDAADAWKFYDAAVERGMDTTTHYVELVEDGSIKVTKVIGGVFESAAAHADNAKKMWKAVLDFIDAGDERAIEKGKELLDSLNKKADDVSEDIGLAFASAASDAIRHWEGVGKLLESIAIDIAQIVFKQSVITPLATGVSSALKSFDWKGFFGFDEGGVMTGHGPMPLKRYAGGGIASSPQFAMFGEGSTPEAFVPLPDGRRIPVHMRGGSGVVVSMPVTIHAPGADIGTVMRMQVALANLERTMIPRVVDAVRRGGQAHQFVRG